MVLRHNFLHRIVDTDSSTERNKGSSSKGGRMGSWQLEVVVGGLAEAAHPELLVVGFGLLDLA